MNQSIYVEMAADTTAKIRQDERYAFEHATKLMRIAQSKGRGSRESLEAVLFVNRLWSHLLEDLASDENGLPASLKAGIISIGIWVLRRAEDIRQGKTDDFSALIDVSETIGMGLGR